MENRLVFSKRRLEALPIPKAGRVQYHDEKTPGLVLRVTRGGQKTFCLYRRIKGQPARVTLGRFPQMSVEQAHRAVAAALADLHAGIDPREAQRHQRESPTLRHLFEHYLESYAKRRSPGRTVGAGLLVRSGPRRPAAYRPHSCLP